jgi:hypothetical protein
MTTLESQASNSRLFSITAMGMPQNQAYEKPILERKSLQHVRTFFPAFLAPSFNRPL